jgi:hypothetical protein
LIDRRNSQGIEEGEPPVAYFCQPYGLRFSISNSFNKTVMPKPSQKLILDFSKQAFEPCLFVNLNGKRTPESRQQVIDLSWQRLQLALAQNPKEYSCRWLLHLMLISKRQK